MQKTVVNSWNEWDPLKHVIVGRADDCHIPPEEPALDAKVPEDSDMRGQWGRRPQETIDRANELLDNFASMLEKRGVRVDRPDSIDHSLPATTPDFHTESQFGCMPPRDVLLTVGSEMLEATMSYRCRWFEYLNYRPLMERYFDEDPNFRHESAPKPRLTDEDYHPDYLSDKIGNEKRLQWAAEKFFVTTEKEPLFDAADVLRFGRDLVVQHGFTTNLKGRAAAAMLFVHLAQHERAGAGPQNRLRRKVRGLSGRTNGQAGHERGGGRAARRLRFWRRAALLHGGCLPRRHMRGLLPEHVGARPHRWPKQSPPCPARWCF